MRQRSTRRRAGPGLTGGGLAALLLLMTLPPAAAQTEPESATAQVIESRRGPTDPVELAAFLDGLMSAHLEDHDIVGATVSVVRDGQPLYSAGYGYADKASRKPVDPATTLFRIGSVSKLFTWTAVMQMVEEGKLDLDEDTESYLDFDIPDTFPQPITMTHLLTHSPGYEDRGLGIFGPTDLSRRDFLALNMPARVRPPGTFISYSNYGTTLAGHVVERLSGLSWEEYIEKRIMEPLGMRYATGRQPLPADLEPHMSTGYSNQDDDVTPQDFEVIGGMAPAGSVSASADAMAKFMIAHLQDGEYQGSRILEEETARRMYRRLLGHDDRLPGYAHGFYEKSSHGLRIVGHGGDTGWFHTDLALVHEEGLGVFVSYNTAAGGQLSFGPFLTAFLDHYYPLEEEPAPKIELSPSELAAYAGSYRFNRSSYTTAEKTMGLFAGSTVQATDDGELSVTTILGTSRFVPVEADLFRDADGSTMLAFRRNDQGRPSHAFLGNIPMMGLERVGPLESPKLHLPILIAASAVFVITVLALPIRALMLRKYQEVRRDSKREREGRWLAWLVAVLNLAFLLCTAVIVSLSNSLMEGKVGGLLAVLTLPVIAALLTVGVLIFAVAAWRNGLWTLWGRIRYTGFTVIAVLFVLILNYWNLLGWKLG